MKKMKRLLALLLAVMVVVGVFAVQASATTIRKCPSCTENTFGYTTSTTTYGSRQITVSHCAAAPSSNNHTHIPGTVRVYYYYCSHCGYREAYNSEAGEWCALTGRFI